MSFITRDRIVVWVPLIVWFVAEHFLGWPAGFAVGLIAAVVVGLTTRAPYGRPPRS